MRVNQVGVPAPAARPLLTLVFQHQALSTPVLEHRQLSKERRFSQSVRVASATVGSTSQVSRRPFEPELLLYIHWYYYMLYIY